MSWKVEHDAELNIVVLTYQGKCTGHDFKTASTARMALAAEKGTAITLIDASQLEVDSSATMDLYEIASAMYSAAEDSFDWRIAILDTEDPQAKEMVDFYETLCINRGWKVKKFATRKSAIAWLL